MGKEPRFHAHAAQFDFEAWLIPYWDEVQKQAGTNRRRPGKLPEHINHARPPFHHVREAFRTGAKGRLYSKSIDAGVILRGKDLLIAAAECPELKSFLNTILSLCDKNAVIH